MKKLLLVAVMALAALLGAPNAQSLTIIRDFTGGNAPTNKMVGQGSLETIFDLACKVWETAIRDDHVVTLRFGWGEASRAHHVLLAQGGSPNRETDGVITFSDNPYFVWSMNPDPVSTSYHQENANLGGRSVNGSRYYLWSETNFVIDLFSVALHEIGHALGLSVQNESFWAQMSGGCVTVSSGPFSGINIPLDCTEYGVHVSYVSTGTLMTAPPSPGQRQMPSVLDILMMGQISGFKDLNLDLAPQLTIRPATVAGKPKTKKFAELSWTQPLPAPAGTQYRVQVCTDLGTGTWQTIGDQQQLLSVNNGTRSMIVEINGNAFFRLKAE